MTQACTSTPHDSALQTMVDELQKVAPDIKGALIFKDPGTILAKDKGTTEESAKKFMKLFNEIEDKTQKIGGLQSLTVFGSKEEISVSNVNGLYFTTIYSKQADKRTIELLTKVLVPTVVKFLDQLTPSSKPKDIMSELIPPLANDNNSETNESLNSEKIKHFDKIVTKGPILSSPNTDGESQPQQFIIDEDTTILDRKLGPPELARSADKLTKNPRKIEVDDNIQKIKIPKNLENELTVERLDSLFLRPNTIRVDKELIAKWKTNSQKKKIERITIESPNKRTASCRFEPITDKRYLGKGVIQVPENIQRALGVALGEIVMTKPISSEE